MSAESAAARAELDREVTEGYAGIFTPAEARLRYKRLLLSKLACLRKLKHDGSVKLRLIHDRKQSGANSYVTLTERIVLPRLIDAIGDLIELLEAELAELDAGGEARAAASDLPDVEQMVIDFTDAFKIVPLHPLERGLAAGKVPNATDLFVYFSLCFR